MENCISTNQTFLPYLSFQPQRSFLCDCEKSPCCLDTRGSPKPRTTPSPGTMRPELESGGSGGPFNSAWRCSLEERSLPIPSSKVLPILMHLPQPFQNGKGQHFTLVNDFLSSSVLKVTGLQRIWELKMVITEHALTLRSICPGCDKRWSPWWV